MKQIRFFFSFILISSFSFCQNRQFEIFGTLTGDFNSKIYLFFEGNYLQRDSISSEIKNGKFYFKGVVPMPIQARLHLDQQSLISDVYIDNRKTYITCNTKMNILNNGEDTLNLLTVVSTINSNTDKLKASFESWADKLKKSAASVEDKRLTYYEKLFVFIKKHPKNKLSPYLLGKSSSLFYSQVKELSSLIDSSLDNTFETKGVKNLLKQLDKSKNRAIGVAFRDIALNDSTGNEINTKQFRGKYTLIVCWASWCKPCRAEHPDLNILYGKYKAMGFEMLGISLDKDKEKWTKAIVKDELYWPQVIDPKAFDGDMAKYYAIEAIPENFLIDKEGKILGVGLTPDEVEAMIRILL
jgi:thiol-disulfide isomerase/thioredoxin